MWCNYRVYCQLVTSYGHSEYIQVRGLAGGKGTCCRVQGLPVTPFTYRLIVLTP